MFVGSLYLYNLFPISIFGPVLKENEANKMFHLYIPLNIYIDFFLLFLGYLKILQFGVKKKKRESSVMLFQIEKK